jgi:hypothetical protein
MFKRIYVEDVDGVGYRKRGSYGIGYDAYSTLFDATGYQPYSVEH